MAYTDRVALYRALRDYIAALPDEDVNAVHQDLLGVFDPEPWDTRAEMLKDMDRLIGENEEYAQLEREPVG